MDIKDIKDIKDKDVNIDTMYCLVGKRSSGKTVIMRHMLNEIGKKEKVKDIIISAFNKKHINFTEQELENEYLIVKSHIKLKHSQHLNSKYDLEHILEILKILT
jgi:predicted AAA+ superfamily ATPase